MPGTFDPDCTESKLMDPLTATQRELYDYSVKHCQAFLTLNTIPCPVYLTYEEAFALPNDSKAFKMLRKLAGGPLQGTATGWCRDGYIFVNLPKCAKPVANPFANRRSYPGNKTDRTPVGVVAHETGHHVEWHIGRYRSSGFSCFKNPGNDWLNEIGARWRELIKKSKTVSGYEPVPSEAWAESMRLFILNPTLLEKAIPERYHFICDLGLVPYVGLHWRAVLNNHPGYCENLERWITRKK